MSSRSSFRSAFPVVAPSIAFALATACVGTVDPQPPLAGDAGTTGHPDGGQGGGTCTDCVGAAWQPHRMDFMGPVATELDDAPNPFLDYRLQVVFSGPSGQQVSVPGFFAGDGQGGETGSVWRVWFTPEEEGTWSYEVHFELGDDLAVAEDQDTGTPIGAPLGPNGETGELRFSAPQRDADGFLGRGRLVAAGGHYLRFQDGGYWLKGGTDSPENLLAYVGFDGTTQSRIHLHDYDAHITHWREGDPDWGDGAGRGIIGAINYLADMRVNSVYALLMNIGGDGQDVWPFAGTVTPSGSAGNDNTHFDLSKLAQWEIVFAHAQRRGIVLHLVLNEAEAANKRELDNGELGIERKLYYREMIARFGHHNAIQWNISEEYDLDFNLGVDRIKAFARYIQDTDPYNHPISVHNASSLDAGWSGLTGFGPITVTSFQIHNSAIDNIVEVWRTRSAESGAPWVVSIDEFTVDADGQSVPWEPVYVPNQYRKLKTWPIYLSGGQLEYILPGYLEVDDFTAFSQLWRDTWHARRFMQEHLPFWDMVPADHLLSGAATYSNGRDKGSISGQVLAKPGQVYAVYVPRATSTGQLDLRDASATFSVRWYNPRTGAFVGDPTMVSGGGWVALGSPPGELDEDWTALVVAQ